MELRLKFIYLAFLVAFVSLVARLFYWQVVMGPKLAVEARNQYHTGRSLTAARGEIYARDSSWLVARGEAWLVYASIPDIVDDVNTIADSLASFFVEDGQDKGAVFEEAGRLKTLLTRNDVVWVPLKNKVSSETKKNIEGLGIAGIGFDFTEERLYPEASASAHLLGFVGKNSQGENEGYFGLEGFYDLPLSGKPGFQLRETDAVGVPIPIGSEQEVSAVSGIDLITNIDIGIQLVLEKKLLKALEVYGATSGSVIIMRPSTGAIIGMSSFPSYEPAKYSDYGDDFFKNPVISSAFEPGSIFKVLVMASGLDAGVIEPDMKCDICGEPYKVDKYFIETWDGKYYPESTMTDVLVHSDNVGMVFIGQKLGVEKLYDHLRAFGIGELTDIDLQGEASPKLRDKQDWSGVDLATATFGQGVAVTPIQMLRAVGAIANDGILVSPQVVSKIKSGDWVEDIKPMKGRRVISEKAANEVTAMMAEAASKGEAKWTNLKGLKVAGKTGTAQIPIAGHYDAEKTIASFVGFAPYDDPEFVMLVTLHEPASSQWASETAAPLWYDIAKDIFGHLGIKTEN